MNKTINVSLGKQFFYIDEEAYLALNNYLDAIKRYLINEEGRDEILADVEARIAELFTEKLQSEREVVQVNEVERVIGIMGKPSDYKVDQDDSNYADGNENDYKQYAGQTKNKKFFRDDEKNLLGGVCAGLAHNFGIDILWMRLLWVILLFLSFGTFILLYVVLWIVVPVARTTAQKLAMMGEPVNISNIEKKVKENAEKAANYAKNFDYEQAAKNGKSSVTQFLEGLGEVLTKIANVIVKIIGFFLVFASGISLISMIISLLSLGSISLFGITDFDFGNSGPFVFDSPVWLQMLTFFFLAVIPVYFIFLLGLKLINNSLKLFKLRTVITLLVFWFSAIAYISFLGIKKEISSSSRGEVVELQDLPVNISDTLSIKVIPNLNFAENVYRSSRSLVKFDPSINENVLWGTSIYIAVQPTTDSIAKLRVSKNASGLNTTNARENANKIDYQVEFNENELLLNAYFLSDVSLKEEDLKLNIVLYLPENMYFKVGKNVSTLKDWRQSTFLKLSENPNDVYQIQDDQIKCTTCINDKPKTKNYD
jgi:phage shock protein PspC (stress-responsive transcriptional regulator)